MKLILIRMKKSSGKKQFKQKDVAWIIKSIVQYFVFLNHEQKLLMRNNINIKLLKQQLYRSLKRNVRRIFNL